MPTKPQIRLPLAPFLETAGGEMMTLARQLGCHHSQVQRWKRDGIPFYNADALAMSVGLHPADVWGEQWWDAGWEQGQIDAPRLARCEARHRARAELVTQYNALERARERVAS